MAQALGRQRLACWPPGARQRTGPGRESSWRASRWEALASTVGRRPWKGPCAACSPGSSWSLPAGKALVAFSGARSRRSTALSDMVARKLTERLAFRSPSERRWRSRLFVAPNAAGDYALDRLPVPESTPRNDLVERLDPDHPRDAVEEDSRSAVRAPMRGALMFVVAPLGGQAAHNAYRQRRSWPKQRVLLTVSRSLTHDSIYKYTYPSPRSSQFS